MSELVTIVMEPRERSGKGATGRLRNEGLTPCVFYGPGMSESVVGKVKTAQVARLVHGRWETKLITMKLPSGAEEMCIIREVQRHPLSGNLLHIDFMRLLKDRKVTVNVPVRVHGKESCPGIKDGGVLESLHEIEVETLPVSIPEFIDVDISNLSLGDVIRVKDLVMGSGVTLLADPDETVAIVAAPRAVEETVTEEPKEVEVVAKGKAAKAEA